jgi:hypothetical protein
MLTNLNPPTLPLVALGLGQAALLQLLKPPLTALMRTRVMRGIVFAVGSRLMTVYLWHLPLILAIAGLGLVVPLIATAPGSAAWWLTRPIVYLVVLGLIFVLSLALGRFERANPVVRASSLAALAIAAVATIVPTAAITIYGLDVWLAVAGAVGYGIAVVLLAAGQNPKSAAPKSAEPKSSADGPATSAPEASVAETSVAPSPDAAS